MRVSWFHEIFFEFNPEDPNRGVKFQLEFVLVLLTLGLVSLYGLLSRYKYQLENERLFQYQAWANQIIGNTNEHLRSAAAGDKPRIKDALAAAELLKNSLEPQFLRSGIASRLTVVVTKEEGEVLRLGPGAAGDLALGTSLFKGSFTEPFQEYQVTFFGMKKQPGSYATGLLFLHILLGTAVPLSLLALYWLGMNQMRLARARANFVTALSHEFRTPLTSMRLYSEMLAAGKTKSENQKQEYYEFILHETERLSRLIDDLLKITGLSGGSSRLELKTVKADEVLRLLTNTAEPMAVNKGFKIAVKEPEIAPGESRPAVKLDYDALTRIFINLIDNALKFAAQHEPKLIDLGFISGPRDVVFFVRDYGPGIESAERKRIFRLFWRGENELTRSTSGTGIGLAVAKDLASGMRAKISVINRSPGCEFQVSFRRI